MRTRQSVVYSLLFMWGIFLIGASVSRAQVVKGAIEGAIADSTGAAVPGAQIDVLDPATSSSGRVSSDTTGAFRIPLLAVGTYNLTVSKEGFRKLSLTQVQVNSNATTRVGRYDWNSAKSLRLWRSRVILIWLKPRKPK